MSVPDQRLIEAEDYVAAIDAHAVAATEFDAASKKLSDAKGDVAVSAGRIKEAVGPNIRRRLIKVKDGRTIHLEWESPAIVYISLFGIDGEEIGTA